MPFENQFEMAWAAGIVLLVFTANRIGQYFSRCRG